MDHYAHSNSEIVRCLAGEGNVGKWSGDALGPTVSGKNRVVVQLKNANINSLAGSDVESAAQLHCETRFPVLDGEIELRKQIQSLLLPVCVTGKTCESVGEGLYASIAAVVLHLYPAKKIVKAFLVAKSLRYARWGELVNEFRALEMAGDVALETKILAHIVRYRHVKAVRVPSLAEEVLSVGTDLVAGRLAAKVRERLGAATGSEAGFAQVRFKPSQRVAAINFYLIVVA